MIPRTCAYCGELSFMGGACRNEDCIAYGGPPPSSGGVGRPHGAVKVMIWAIGLVLGVALAAIAYREFW